MIGTRKSGRPDVPSRPGNGTRPAGQENARHENARHQHEDIEATVITDRDDQGAFLIRELQKQRVLVRHVWPLPALMPAEGDVLYVDYQPDLSRRLPWLPGEAKSALVVILPQIEPVQPDAIANATPDALLARPFTANAVLMSLVMARSQFRYEQRLRTKVDRLDENLRSMRMVERAKSILMASRQFAADEAYNFMRNQAMDRRVSVASVAAAIVSSHELLGPTIS